MPPNLTTGPTTPVLDNFNRANGALGSAWAGPAGQLSDDVPTINNNQVYQQADGKAGSAYLQGTVYDFNAGPVECFIDIPVSGYLITQIIGYTYAVGYYYRLVNDSSNGWLRLVICHAGTDNVVQTLSGVSVTGGGKIWMWVEPTPSGPGLDIYCMYKQSGGAWNMCFAKYTDTSLVRTSGYIGLRLQGTSTVTSSADNFGGGALSTSATVVSPAASVSMGSVAPAFRVDDSVIAPPATVSAQSIAPMVSIPKTVVAPYASFSAQSVAPAISGTAVVISPPALFTSVAVAPISVLSPIVLPGAATWTATAVSPGLGRQIISTSGVFTASMSAPGTGNLLVPPAAFWMASAVAPAPTIYILAAVGTFTSSSVTPVVVQGLFSFPNACLLTVGSVAPTLSILQTVTVPASIWTASPIAPLLVKTLFPNVVLSTFSTIAPALSIVTPITAALVTFRSGAPSFISGTGQSLAIPPATFSAAAVAPSTSVLVVVPYGSFTASIATPVLVNVLAASSAIMTQTSVAPVLARSPLVLMPAPVTTMIAGAPSILTGVGTTAPIFTASASPPSLSISLAPTAPTFTAVIPAVQLGHTIVPSPIRTTFTSAASIQMIVQLPVGVWSAAMTTPSVALQVPAPAGKLTMSSMTISMDVEKTVSMDVARWTAQLPAPALSIILKSPVPIWVGSPQNPQIGRGSIAVPAYVNFSAVEPDVQQESTTAVYTYVPGEVVESNAWPMWQH